MTLEEVYKIVTECWKLYKAIRSGSVASINVVTEYSKIHEAHRCDFAKDLCLAFINQLIREEESAK